MLYLDSIPHDLSVIEFLLLVLRSLFHIAAQDNINDLNNTSRYLLTTTDIRNYTSHAIQLITATQTPKKRNYKANEVQEGEKQINKKQKNTVEVLLLILHMI
jgi:hypothetical protein